MLKATLLLLGLCTVSLHRVAVGDIYAAMSEMEDVLETESRMLAGVDEYLRQEKERIRKIESKLENIKRLHQGGMEDTEGYLSHPMNAFLLLKRFMWEWVDLENWIKISMPAREYVFNSTKHWEKAPAQADLDGAASALWRIQDMYKVDVASLVDGANTEASLKAHICFEVGRLAYRREEDMRHAAKWFTEAYHRLDNESIRGDFFSLNETEILDHLAYTTYSAGHLREAISYTDKLLEKSPDSQRYKDNKNYYQYLLDKEERPRGEMGDLKGVDWEAMEKEAEDLIEEADGRKVKPARQEYEALCRGDSARNKTWSYQHCSYQHHNRPELILQPAKEEVVFDRPRVVVFRDVIQDSDIDFIKSLAKPRLARATIWNSTAGRLEPSEHRVSKSSWVTRADGETVRRLYRRMEAFTGLNSQSAEELQVVNYGLGGHYEPHFDFTKDSSIYGSGNRIATILFYLSDVGGGATVFPQLGLRVPPEKGSAVFWYNLSRNGVKDMDTKHAACPVLSGSKWVANIWMHEHGQEFRRPCDLQRKQ